MTGIQFVTDAKGRKVAVLIDLKKHGAQLQDLRGGLVSESRRKEKGIPLAKVKADLMKRGQARQRIFSVTGRTCGERYDE